MTIAAEIQVEVTYALPQQSVSRIFRVATPATVGAVLDLAAADPVFNEVNFANATVGVFGTIANAGQILEDGDRVEIYRPLAADPKIARRARAQEARRKP